MRVLIVDSRAVQTFEQFSVKITFIQKDEKAQLKKVCKSLIQLPPSRHQHPCAGRASRLYRIYSSNKTDTLRKTASMAMNVTYPKKAREFTGKVIVGFVVEKDGSIRNENIKIKQGVHDDLLDKVAIRLVKSMPKWTPAFLGISL
jgi:hypothetical protein